MPIGDELTRLDQDLQKKAGERQRVVSLFRKGLITDAEAEPELRELEREAATLEGRRLTLVDQDSQRQQLRARVIDAKLLLEQLGDKLESAGPGQKADLVRALVEGITVDTVIDERGRRRPKVTIRYRFERPPTDDMDCVPAVWTASRS